MNFNKHGGCMPCATGLATSAASAVQYFSASVAGCVHGAFGVGMSLTAGGELPASSHLRSMPAPADRSRARQFTGVPPMNECWETLSIRTDPGPPGHRPTAPGSRALAEPRVWVRDGSVRRLRRSPAPAGWSAESRRAETCRAFQFRSAASRLGTPSRNGLRSGSTQRRRKHAAPVARWRSPRNRLRPPTRSGRPHRARMTQPAGYAVRCGG